MIPKGASMNPGQIDELLRNGRHHLEVVTWASWQSSRSNQGCQPVCDRSI